MYTSLFDSFLPEPFFPHIRTIYVVSDSQLEEIKRKKRQEELDNIGVSRKKLRKLIKHASKQLMSLNMSWSKITKRKGKEGCLPSLPLT